MKARSRKFRVASPEEATGAANPVPAKIPAMGLRISIVEDDPEAREMLAEWLNSTPGFCCISKHGDGLSAVEELPSIRPEVVLMDINLPGMKGIECVRRLKPEMP